MKTADALKAPALLVTADYYGTLSAARCLGRRGIDVVMGDARRLAPARWSRYVTRAVSCPSPEDTAAFEAWLLDFGRAHPGHVLYPTSDETAWLYAKNASRLEPYFHLYSPPLRTIDRVLDKNQLHDAARAAGLQAPPSYAPADLDEVAVIAEKADYPLLIKPRTQVLSDTHSKGVVVTDKTQLVEAYRAYVAKNAYRPQHPEDEPTATLPLLQAYFADAADGIVTIAGFIDATGELAVSRSSRKILQKPQKLGIGVCFEAYQVPAETVEALATMCREVGYFGAFDAEFIASPDGPMLVDFNPRYYNQMEFEAARGLPIPWLVQLAAVGDEAGLRDAVEKARVHESVDDLVFRDRVGFFFSRFGQLMGLHANPRTYLRWGRWKSEHRGRIVEAAGAPDDRRPAVFDALNQVVGYARDPRWFVRRVLLDG